MAYKKMSHYQSVTQTPTVTVLQVEMEKMALGLRREQLRLTYWANLQGQGKDHPTLEVLKPCWEKGRRKLKSFGWVVGKELENLN